MSYVHSVANDLSEEYLANEKRYNYTTPKTFLEQISLYSKLLTDKVRFLENSITRFEVGLLKLASAAEEVDGLKEVLAVQEVTIKFVIIIYFCYLLYLLKVLGCQVSNFRILV